MRDKYNYKKLELGTNALMIVLTLTVILLLTNFISLEAFKISLFVMLFVSYFLYFLLRRTITYTIRKSNKLQDEVSKFSTLLSSNIIGVLITNSKGEIKEANDTFLNLIGYSRLELEEGSLTKEKLLTNNSLFFKNSIIKEINIKGFYHSYTTQLLKKNKEKIWILIGSYKLDNNLDEVISYVIDVTKNKESENRALELQNIIEKERREFKSVLKNAPVLISIKRGENLDYEFINDAIYEFFEDALPKEDVLKLLEQNVFESNIDKFEKVFRDGVTISGIKNKIVYTDKDNKEKKKYLDTIFSPVYDYNNKIDGVATFGFDVTQLVKANQEMEISRNRFSIMANSILHQVWMADIEGKLSYMNKYWLDYIGLEDFTNLNLFDTIHQEDIETVKTAWDEAVLVYQEFSVEARLKDKDGCYRWHLVRGLPLLDSSGDFITWIGTNSDIHDQKIKVKQLIHNENYFRTISNETPFMIWKTNELGECIYVNKKWVEFTGFSFNESMREGLSLLVQEHQSEEYEEKWERSIRTKKSFKLKLEVIRCDGAGRVVLAQANPYFLDENFQGFVGSVLDITEQEQLRKEEKAMSAKKEEFLSIASHELKTPLTSVKAFIQLIEKNLAPGEKSHDYSLKALANLKRLETLIADLLDITKINAGKMVYNIASFNFNDMLTDTINSFKSITSTHTLINDFNTDLIIEGDRFRIEQVLYNFLSNAIKYSPKQSEVIVKSYIEDKQVIVSVQDFGIGIAPEDLGSLSNRYYRVDRTAIKFQGLGLGLFISSEILARHGGKFWVNSKINEGSTFYFSIPLEHKSLLLKNDVD